MPDFCNKSTFLRQGQTGYPWIDAIMTQLREEGWIHHLARHAVACFLTRGDLWISWEEGMKVNCRDCSALLFHLFAFISKLLSKITPRCDIFVPEVHEARFSFMCHEFDGEKGIYE